MISKRAFEAALDWIAAVAGALFLALMLAGVFTLAEVGWSVGVFTGWLLRHLLD